MLLVFFPFGVFRLGVLAREARAEQGADDRITCMLFLN